MIFNRVFVEEELKELSNTKAILEQLNATDAAEWISSYEDYFGRFKKPYLHKRTNLNLYLARKKGQLVKPAPDAYGLKGEPHYYFIHAYNCIYECEYCYLQGYFNSPDIVLFTNHDEIEAAIEDCIKSHYGDSLWFHAGEFSDSLALSHITNECQFYHRVFSKHPQAKLELRTKSANIRELKKLEPLPNMITSFSLSPASQTKSFDRKTAPLNARLKAIKELQELGHPIALHLDPIIWQENYMELYEELMQQLQNQIDVSAIEYVSLGVVRFTKSVHREMEKNYPESKMLQVPMVTTENNLVRYRAPLRTEILNTVSRLVEKAGVNKDRIYNCME